MGTMADPEELLDALHALGAIRAPTAPERERMAHEARTRELWRLETAQYLAGVVELQLLMAGGAAADAVEEQTPATATPILLAGWKWFSGGAAPDDDARVGLLAVLAHRLNEMLMLMVARWRKGEGDELLSPLLMPSLAIASTLEQLLKATAEETSGNPDPRRELGEVAEHLRHTADVLESMTPAEHLKPDRREPAAAFRRGILRPDAG